MFWLLLILCFEQTTKSTTNLFSKPVFHDGKTVNYHTGQLTPKLRMLSYPLHFKTTLAHRARTRSAHKLWTEATFHSCFVWLTYSEFGSFIEWHASAAPWMRSDAVHGVCACLAVSLCWAQLFCLLDNQIPFLVVTCKYCKWCMHPAPQCPTSWTIQQTAIFGILPKQSMIGACHQLFPHHPY